MHGVTRAYLFPLSDRLSKRLISHLNAKTTRNPGHDNGAKGKLGKAIEKLVEGANVPVCVSDFDTRCKNLLLLCQRYITEIHMH